MTEELPKRDSRTIRCTDCNQPVTLRRKPNNLLYVSCGCEDAISTRVASALPEEWSQ